MSSIENILISLLEKRNNMLRFLLIMCVQCIFLPSCKNDVVSYEKSLLTYGATPDSRRLIKKHKIHFSLPSKYRILGDRVPSIYSQHTLFSYSCRDMRENIYIADTVRYNWFYYEPASKFSDSVNVSEFIKGSLSQLECMGGSGNMYDFSEEKLENGNEKYVFISYRPSKVGSYGWSTVKEDLGVDLYINCLLKTKDDYGMTFFIRSFEPLAEFNFQEKMDIINSIYVE